MKPGPEGGGGGGEAEFPVQEGAAADAEAAGELVMGQTSLQALGLEQGGERSGSSGPGRLIGSEGGQGQAAKRFRNPPLPPSRQGHSLVSEASDWDRTGVRTRAPASAHPRENVKCRGDPFRESSIASFLRGTPERA